MNKRVTGPGPKFGKPREASALRNRPVSKVAAASSSAAVSRNQKRVTFDSRKSSATRKGKSALDDIEIMAV